MFNYTVTNSGYLFFGFINGRYISEFISSSEAANLSEAIDIRVERLGC